ncbi:hypothetical protein D3C71_325410 [compost metagenome]
MVERAGRREGAGYGKQHDLLAGEKTAGRNLHRAICRLFLERCFRKLFAYCDRHVVSPAMIAHAIVGGTIKLANDKTREGRAYHAELSIGSRSKHAMRGKRSLEGERSFHGALAGKHQNAPVLALHGIAFR